MNSKGRITRSVKISTDLDAEIEKAMKSTGTVTFTEFVHRALAAEVRLTEARLRQIDAMASEDPSPYNQTKSKKAI